MPTTEPIDLRSLRGYVAIANTTGLVHGQTSDCLLRLALHNASLGLQVEYGVVACTLVEAGRDAILQHALSEKYDYCLQIDGDATFGEDALVRLLHTAFITHPHADVVGAYAQLKGSYLPTCDTGTGTWEAHFPGSGVLEVMRTGGHFLLVKTPILRRFGPPWFRTRQTLKPIRAFAEIDNYARMKLDGSNPFSSLPEWETLISAARAESPAESSVGEDSGFCDQVKAAGGTILVNTDVLTGHLELRSITPLNLKERIDQQAERLAASVGVLT